MNPDNPDVTYVYLEPFFAHLEECCNCGVDVQRYFFQPNYGLPLYEGLAVPPEWEGEWGGFPACKECHDKYERRELPMWTIEDLEWSTSYETRNESVL